MIFIIFAILFGVRCPYCCIIIYTDVSEFGRWSRDETWMPVQDSMWNIFSQEFSSFMACDANEQTPAYLLLFVIELRGTPPDYRIQHHY